MEVWLLRVLKALMCLFMFSIFNRWGHLTWFRRCCQVSS